MCFVCVCVCLQAQGEKRNENSNFLILCDIFRSHFHFMYAHAHNNQTSIHFLYIWFLFFFRQFSVHIRSHSDSLFFVCGLTKLANSTCTQRRRGKKRFVLSLCLLIFVVLKFETLSRVRIYIKFEHIHIFRLHIAHIGLLKCER